MIFSTQKRNRGISLALTLIASIAATGCLSEATTSTFSLQVVGTDDEAASYTSGENDDPRIGAVYMSTTANSLTGVAGMNVAYYADKQADGKFNKTVLLTFVPNGSNEATTYSATSTDVSAIYLASGASYTTLSTTPATITVSNYGEVGKFVEGTYDVTLCETTAILNCTEAEQIQLKGSFSALRAADK